jgi:NifB/MoaA-like Fe-S oxidoreductase
MATGAAAFRLIEYIAGTVEKKVANIEIEVVKIPNKLFGDKITVAGLLTGNDIVGGLENAKLYDELLIPAVSLRNERDIFLDDMSVEELSQKLNIKVTPVENDGYELLDKILGEQEG